MACRTPEILRWHFTPPHPRCQSHVVCCHIHGRLAGYLILQTGVAGLGGLRKAIVADLIALDERDDVIAELFAASYAIAKRERCDVLEVLGFPQEIRRVCLDWKPLLRKYPSCPFYFKARRDPLRESLAREQTWYACPFDGDTTLSA
jgi:hypothetical protein